jgi:regulator of sigma D
MRLIKELMKKKIELYNECELTHDYLKAVWHFYIVYQVAINLIAFEDKQINLKNRLFKKLVESSKDKLDFSTYSKLAEFMKKDNEIINRAFYMLEKQMEESQVLGDYKQDRMVAINIYDG